MFLYGAIVYHNNAEIMRKIYYYCGNVKLLGAFISGSAIRSIKNVLYN